MSPSPTFWSSARLLLSVGIIAVGLSGASAMAGGSAPATAPLAQTAADGAAVYAENCASCHQPGGVGIVGTFPPLAGNPASADTAYVEDVVRNGLSGPIEVLGVAYDATMASFDDLSDDDVAAVAAYVATLSDGGGAGVPDDDQPVVEPGDVDEGRALFVGSDRLTAGGGSCAGCHTAGDVGNLGGWGLGPDLTDSIETFGGEAGLSGWLANPSSPVMQPIFGDRPMTDNEIADVVAFLADAPDQKRPADPGDGLLYAGGVGLAVLIAGMAIAWRGMRQTYVERLRSRR